ncbi:hypothetical protein LJC59_03265 [Desulfovibrio sp. OttesenSCG-928-A18]|nr:hypothetical protein [Desulfovibrio sp. OttesenSCG-928-A18]
MAGNLFIRVSAVTYDEKEVPRSWPLLFMAVWPDPGLDGFSSPAKLARKLVPAANRGVLELARAVDDFAHYGDVPEAGRAKIEAAAEKLRALLEKLDAALGDRDVQGAHKLCAQIEDALDEAETIMQELR